VQLPQIIPSSLVSRFSDGSYPRAFLKKNPTLLTDEYLANVAARRIMPRTYSPTHFCRNKIGLGVTGSRRFKVAFAVCSARMFAVSTAHHCRHFHLIMIIWGDFDLVTEMMMLQHRNTLSEMCSVLQCAAGRINHWRVEMSDDVTSCVFTTSNHVSLQEKSDDISWQDVILPWRCSFSWHQMASDDSWC